MYASTYFLLFTFSFDNAMRRNNNNTVAVQVKRKENHSTVACPKSPRSRIILFSMTNAAAATALCRTFMGIR